MKTSETGRVIDGAEHLLWVLARQDVEALHVQRQYVLQRLCELEKRAGELGIPDLYRAAFQNACGRGLLQSSYGDG